MRIDLSAKYFIFGVVRELKQVTFFLDFTKWVLPPIDSYRIVYSFQIQILGIQSANLTRLLFHAFKEFQRIKRLLYFTLQN